MAGSITAYRCPSTQTNSFIGRQYGAGPTATFEFCPLKFAALPPGTQSQAALFPNSRTWQASQGLYQVAVFNSTNNPFVSPTPGVCGLIDAPTSAQLAGDLDRIAYLSNGSFITNTTAAFASSQHLYPIDVSGCVITNTSGTLQTYQLTVKYYIERIPTQSDPDLLVLTRDPTPYDPIVLEIYSRAMNQLPVGVTVGENPLGEWFEDVMGVVAAALPALGTFLTPVLGPVSAAAGASLGAAAAGAALWNKTERENEMRRREEQSARDKALASTTKNLTTQTGVTIANRPVVQLPRVAASPGYKSRQRELGRARLPKMKSLPPLQAKRQ
jgi:hypothetical protein